MAESDSFSYRNVSAFSLLVGVSESSSSTFEDSTFVELLGDGTDS